MKAAFCAVLFAFGLASSACARRGESEASPFVHCVSREAPARANGSVGTKRLSVEGDRAKWAQTNGSPSLAIFRGRAPYASSLRQGLACLATANATGVIVLGDFGDRPSHVRAFVADLVAANVLVGLLPGGRDRVSFLDEALGALDDDARARFVDLSRIRRVEVGTRVLFPVAGSDASSRIDSDVCGYDESDVARLLENVDLNVPDGALIVAWLAPSTDRLGIAGASGGSDVLRRFAQRLGVRGAVAAWPPHRAGASVADVFVAPNLAGAKSSLSNGDFASRGFVLVREEGVPEFVTCP